MDRKQKHHDLVAVLDGYEVAPRREGDHAQKGLNPHGFGAALPVPFMDLIAHAPDKAAAYREIGFKHKAELDEVHDKISKDL
jgi:hypothetical protein